MNKLLISPLIAQQLPDFIRGDYPVFVRFLEKYYEWMEQSGNMIDEAGNLRFAQDFDLATDEYIELVQQEFLPFFPESITLDKRKFLKLVSQFYNAKGTPNSIKFLFRALFNEDVDVYYPKDDILIASDGKWVLPLALRVDTNDNNILNIERCLITGETSKATAIVERVIRSVDRQLGIPYNELYISNVDRLFQTGETITTSYNDGVVDVTVSARLIGALSEIKIDPKNRGLFYDVGNPVSIVGGLNPESLTSIGAIATVGEVTKGSITDIIVTNGGFGFRDPKEITNNAVESTSIIDFKSGFDDSVFTGTEAEASINLVDSDTVRTITVCNTTIEFVYNQANQIMNIESSAVGSIPNTTYQTFNVHPISFVSIDGGGGGYKYKPEVEVYSFYREDEGDVLVLDVLGNNVQVQINKGSYVISNPNINFNTYFDAGDTVRFYIANRMESIRKVVSVSTNSITIDEPYRDSISGITLYKVMRSDIRSIGSLGRIIIERPGDGYVAGEYLTFSGGLGYGANAIITSVDVNGGIESVQMIPTDDFIIGGEGYSMSSLPTVSVDTVAGANAVLTVTEITGDGEYFDLTTSRIGSISKLRVTSYGSDYVSVPTVSLKNASLTLHNLTQGQLFVTGSKVYQGTSNTNTTFEAYVDKFTVEDSDNTRGTLIIYDFNGTLTPNTSITSDDGVMSGTVIASKFYGDGRAKATAIFENGLIRLPGLYLNTDGHISSDKFIQDGKKYHNFSYVVNTNQDTSKFKNTLDNIIHPTGTILFVNRIDRNSDMVSCSGNDYLMIRTTLPVTCNVVNGSLSMISTNNEIDIQNYVDSNNYIIINNMNKYIRGTVNVSSGSNTVTGFDTDFIVDLQIGDIISISTGNTETIQSIVSNNIIITQNVINVTDTNQTMNLVFDEIKKVTNVTSDIIYVDTAFTTNATFATVLVQKVE